MATKLRAIVKKTKLFALPKFGSLRGNTPASLKIGKIFRCLVILKPWLIFALISLRFYSYTYENLYKVNCFLIV